MLRTISSVSLFLSSVVVGNCVVVCSLAAQPQDKALASTLVTGLRRHTDHLQSGIVNIEVLDGKGRTLVRRFVAFDKKADKVRSDTEVVFQSPKRTVKLIHTKKEFLRYLDSQGHTELLRLNPDKKSDLSEGMPIDARMIGLIEYCFLEQGGRVEEYLKSLEGLADKKLVSATLEKGIGTLVFEPLKNKDSVTRYTCWIDTTKDYVPVKTEARQISADGKLYWIPNQLESSWEEINKTWVPVKSVASFFGLDNKLDRADDMRIKWKSVNKEVPEEFFTEEGLKLPNGTYIMDMRQGKPVLERVVGRPTPPGAQ
jgi:hypothetical protein